MIRLPENVDQFRSEKMTLRFASKGDCGYIMLLEAGSARLAHRIIALDHDAEYARNRGEFGGSAGRIAEIEAEKQAAIDALNAARYSEGDGQHCLTLTVSEAISLVLPIEQIKKLSEKGVQITGHAFTTAEVALAATQVLERFEHSICQVAEAAKANTKELGMFQPADGPNP